VGNYAAQDPDSTQEKEKGCTTLKDFLRPFRAEARAVTLGIHSHGSIIKSMNLFRRSRQFCSSVSERQVDKARVIPTKGSLPRLRCNPTNRQNVQ